MLWTEVRYGNSGSSKPRTQDKTDENSNHFSPVLRKQDKFGDKTEYKYQGEYFKENTCY